MTKYKNSQQLKSKKRSRKPAIIAVVLILALVGAGALYKHYHTTKHVNTTPVRPTNSVDYNPPTAAEKAAADQQKNQIVGNTDSKDSTPTTTTTNNSSSLTVSIVRWSNASGGQPLSVRTLVDGTTSGTCHASFTKAGQTTVTKDFPVSFEATSATCSGMDIPASDFPATGNWLMNIVVQNGSMVSTAASQTVVISP